MSLDDGRWLSGVARFDAGLYFEAHEDFEALWRAASGPETEFFQALAQAAAALHHASRGNAAGAAYLEERCRGRLERFAGPSYGVDVPVFLAALRVRLRSPDAPAPRLTPPEPGVC
jgi:hypothetical protein